MGQFKPMVKMMTTEPTVELKLKKGGTVKGHKNMKSGGCMKDGGKAEGHGHSYMNGGISAALAGEPMIAPKRRRIAPTVGKPSLAARRAAMAGAKAGARAGAKQGALNSMMGGMKKGGAMEALKKHEEKPASKAHKGLKTGGVAKGQGGYKTGGVIKGQGGYKKGGSAKKFAEGGSVQDGGRPQKMAQGAKKPSSAVSIDKLSGTFKKGGKVKKYADGGTVDATGRPVGNMAPPIPAEMMTRGNPLPPEEDMYSGSMRIPDNQNRPMPNMRIPDNQNRPMPNKGNLFAGVQPTRETRTRLNFNPPVVPPKYDNTFRGKRISPSFINDFGKYSLPPGTGPVPPRPRNMGIGVSGGMPRPYKKGGKVKGYAEGGMSDYEQYMSPEEQLKEMRMRKAMEEGYRGTRERETASNEALLDSLSSLPKAVKDMVKKAMRGPGAVTDTETTVSRTVVPAQRGVGTVSGKEVARRAMPAKKHGGKVRK